MISLDLNFSLLAEEDRPMVEALCSQFALSYVLSDSKKFTSTGYFKSFRNAIILLGGKCHSNE